MASCEKTPSALGNTPLSTLQAVNCSTYKKFADEQRKILSAKYPFLQKSQINRKTADLWATMSKSLPLKSKRLHQVTRIPRPRTPRPMPQPRDAYSTGCLPRTTEKGITPRLKQGHRRTSVATDKGLAKDGTTVPRKKLHLDLFFENDFTESEDGSQKERPVSKLPSCPPGGSAVEDSGESDSDAEGRLMQINQEIQAHAADSQDEDDVVGALNGDLEEKTVGETQGESSPGKNPHDLKDEESPKGDASGNGDLHGKTATGNMKGRQHAAKKTSLVKDSSSEVESVDKPSQRQRTPKTTGGVEDTTPGRITRNRTKRSLPQENRDLHTNGTPPSSQASENAEKPTSHGGTRRASRLKQQHIDDHLKKAIASPEQQSSDDQSVPTELPVTKPTQIDGGQVNGKITHGNKRQNANNGLTSGSLKGTHQRPKAKQKRSPAVSPYDFYSRPSDPGDSTSTGASPMSLSSPEPQQSPALLLPFPDLAGTSHSPSPTPTHKAVLSAVDKAVLAMRSLVPRADNPPSPQEATAITSRQLSSLSSLSSLESQGSQDFHASPYSEDPFSTVKIYSPRQRESRPSTSQSRRTRSRSLGGMRSPQSARRRLTDKLLQVLNEASQNSLVDAGEHESSGSSMQSPTERPAKDAPGRQSGNKKRNKNSLVDVSEQESSGSSMQSPTERPDKEALGRQSGNRKRKKKVDGKSGESSKKVDSASDSVEEDQSVNDGKMKDGKASRKVTDKNKKKQIKPLQADITRYLTVKPLPNELPFPSRPDTSLCGLFEEVPTKKPSRTRRRLLTGSKAPAGPQTAFSTSMLDEAAFIES